MWSRSVSAKFQKPGEQRLQSGMQHCTSGYTSLHTYNTDCNIYSKLLLYNTMMMERITFEKIGICLIWNLGSAFGSSFTVKRDSPHSCLKVFYEKISWNSMEKMNRRIISGTRALWKVAGHQCTLLQLQIISGAQYLRHLKDFLKTVFHFLLVSQYLETIVSFCGENTISWWHCKWVKGAWL